MGGRGAKNSASGKSFGIQCERRLASFVPFSRPTRAEIAFPSHQRFQHQKCSVHQKKNQSLFDCGGIAHFDRLFGFSLQISEVINDAFSTNVTRVYSHALV